MLLLLGKLQKNNHQIFDGFLFLYQEALSFAKAGFYATLPNNPTKLFYLVRPGSWLYYIIINTQMIDKFKIKAKEITNKVWQFLDKPRQFIFRLPYLQRLPVKIQRWIYFAFSPFVLGLLLMVYLFWGLPFPTQITSESRNPVSTQILDRNGKLIYEIFEEKRRTPIKLNELPPYVYQATLAIEDKNFYKHFGLSLTGMARALFKTTVKQDLQGGSTITQQLVKTTLLSPERTVRRKIREAVLTILVEIIYTKDKILESYLNNVPYGGTAWGIETAAQTYFNKSVKDLKLSEAALLAGLTQAPTRYSPFGSNPQRAIDRQHQVL